jgi:outer membrane receptor protein involved in Fe transport
MNGNFIKFAITLFVYVFYSFNLIASDPGKIEGSVTDAETNKIVPFATVELLRSRDSTLVSGTLTNNEGKYLLENVPYGKYLLRISFLGYRKEFVSEFELTAQKSSIKFGNTNLITESKSLGEVVVTGHKLTGVLEDDKTIYAIKNRSAEIAQSGLELLRQLPDVTVDYISDNVKLAGSNNILFQLNGRIVDRNYLMQLNPGLVDKIEVITNPGAKYDSDIDAVINIILKKNIQSGLSARMRLDIPTSGTILGKNNGSIDLFYKKVRFYIAGNYNLQKYNSESSNRRITFSPDSSVLSQNITGKNYGNKAGFSYGVDWFSNDNNLFNFYSSVRPNIPVKSILTSENVFTSNQISTHNKSRNSSITKNYYYDYSLYYQHKFAKKFHEISFESYLSNKRIINISDYYEQNYISEGIITDQLSNELDQITENNTRQLILKVDYTYPFSEKVKLSAGYNGNLLRADFLYNDAIADYSDLINYDENRHSVYSNLSWNVGKVNLQTGVRYEISEVHIVHGYDTTNQYNSLLPSVSAQYKLGKNHTFRLSYRKSVTRPTVNQLSPTNYKDDSYMQSTGNPDLKPAYSDRLELTHRIQLVEPMYLSYRPYISFIKNDIRQVYFTTSDSVLLRKYNNVSNDIEYGVTISGTLALMKIWTISPSFTYYKRELKALPEYGINDPMNRTSWRLNVSSQIVIPKDWVVIFEYNYNAPIINYQSVTHNYYDFVVGLNKSISKKVSISVFSINPWSKNYVYDNMTITTDKVVQDTKNTINLNHLFFIRLSYKFNIGKSGKKLDRQIETNEEQGGGKGIIK